MFSLSALLCWLGWCWLKHNIVIENTLEPFSSNIDALYTAQGPTSVKEMSIYLFSVPLRSQSSSSSTSSSTMSSSSTTSSTTSTPPTSTSTPTNSSFCACVWSTTNCIGSTPVCQTASCSTCAIVSGVEIQIPVCPGVGYYCVFPNSSLCNQSFTSACTNPGVCLLNQPYYPGRSVRVTNGACLTPTSTPIVTTSTSLAPTSVPTSSITTSQQTSAPAPTPTPSGLYCRYAYSSFTCADPYTSTVTQTCGVCYPYLGGGYRVDCGTFTTRTYLNSACAGITQGSYLVTSCVVFFTTPQTIKIFSGSCPLVVSFFEKKNSYSLESTEH